MKRVMICILTLLMLLSVCACGNNNVDSADDNQTKSFTKDTPLEQKLDGIWLCTDEFNDPEADFMFLSSLIFTEDGYFYDGFESSKGPDIYNDSQCVMYYRNLLNYDSLDAVVYSAYCDKHDFDYDSVVYYDQSDAISDMEELYENGYVEKFKINDERIYIRDYYEDGVENDMGDYKLELVDDNTILFYYDGDDCQPFCLHRAETAYPASDTYFIGNWSFQRPRYNNTFEWPESGNSSIEEDGSMLSDVSDQVSTWSYSDGILVIETKSDDKIYTDQYYVIKISNNVFIQYNPLYDDEWICDILIMTRNV